MSYADLIATWPVPHASAAVMSKEGTLAYAGDVDRIFPLASVTKMLTAYAVLIAVEEGAVDLDEPAGPPSSTVRHLLAHAAGYEFDRKEVRSTPGQRRMYSNAGFEVLADHLSARTGIEFARYAHEAVFGPLGMDATSLGTSPAAGGTSCVRDLAAFGTELLDPTLIDASTLREATSVQFPGIDGLLPGYGRQKPNDWGLGFEIRDHKSPHWTASSASARTFGHFGQSGTFLWIDPDVELACVALTDRDFGPWAITVWPDFSEAVYQEFGAL